MTASTGQAGLPVPASTRSSSGQVNEPRARDGFVRDRQHRFPGRKNALKVLYDDTEVAAVRSAAQVAGLTPTGFVAAAGLTLAGAALPLCAFLVGIMFSELL